MRRLTRLKSSPSLSELALHDNDGIVHDPAGLGRRQETEQISLHVSVQPVAIESAQSLIPRASHHDPVERLTWLRLGRAEPVDIGTKALPRSRDAVTVLNPP